MLIAFLLLFIPVSSGGAVQDQGNDSLPGTYYKFQYAGNMGLVSVGVGKTFKQWFSTDVHLGYLPKYVNGVRVFTFSVRPVITTARFSVGGSPASWYIGSAVNYSAGRHIYGKIPDYYPLDYYWPNAFYFTHFTGLRYSPGKKGKVKLFSELGTVDYKIWYASKNKDINIFEIWNFSFGIMIDRVGNKKEK